MLFLHNVFPQSTLLLQSAKLPVPMSKKLLMLVELTRELGQSF